MNHRIGIMGAMPEETDGILELMEHVSSKTSGQRVFHSGRIGTTEVVLVYSRWGKVAAATTASALIYEYHISALLFTGVAGALQAGLNIGDVVLATRTRQHDLDGSPIFPRFEIPLLGRSWLYTDPRLNKAAEKAVTDLLHEGRLETLLSKNTIDAFGLYRPRMVKGDIISGDQFIASQEEKDRLLADHPAALCVEMEGAAVAQVCFEHNLPFAIIRTISDVADHVSPVDFKRFISEVASRYAKGIVAGMFS